MTAALTLERFAHELIHFAHHVPDTARRAARLCIADAVACAAIGIDSDAYRRSRLVADQMFGGDRRQATVWFAGHESSIATAVYLNSLAVSAHDLDDGNRAAIGHPGGVVIPTALAELEAANSSLDPLDVIAVGYEAGIRIAAARTGSRVPTMATGRWAAFASAAVSSYVAGHDHQMMAAALAHAGSLAPQLIPPDPRRVDGLKEATPWSAIAGMAAARLAEAGVPAPTYLLERHHDFDHGSLATVRVSDRPSVCDTYFKRYACCRWIHPAIDLVLAMQDVSPIDACAIEMIEIHTFERSLTLNNPAAPTNLEDAHYSFPFCVALALRRGPEALMPIRQTALHDVDVIGLAKRTRLVHDPALDSRFPAATPAVVTVHAGNDTREAAAATAQGDPSLPFADAVLNAKHRHLLASIGVPGDSELLQLTTEHRAVSSGALTAALGRKPTPGADQ